MHTKPNSDANAVAVVAASEKLAKRNNITQEKRRSRALSTPSPKNNLSPSSSPPPTTSGTPPIASSPTLMPSASTLLNDDDQDRSHAFSVVSDSYDPDSSHIPSRRSSVSSVDTASSSYDSEFPDRVPTPTPPSSPRKIQKPVEKEEEKEEPKRKLKVKGSRWREIGYLAAVSQLIGAYIFYISCITGIHSSFFLLYLPFPSSSIPLIPYLGMRHVIDEDSVGQVQGLYWTPQVCTPPSRTKQNIYHLSFIIYLWFIYDFFVGSRGAGLRYLGDAVHVRGAAEVVAHQARQHRLAHRLLELAWRYRYTLPPLLSFPLPLHYLFLRTLSLLFHSLCLVAACSASHVLGLHRSLPPFPLPSFPFSSLSNFLCFLFFFSQVFVYVESLATMHLQTKTRSGEQPSAPFGEDGLS